MEEDLNKSIYCLAKILTWQFVNGVNLSEKPEFKLNQWYRHEQGYYVRYYPDGYKKTTIQVYVPETTADGENLINYILFDPTSISIAPANTNAQRLGIGAPVVIDIIRTVIKVIDLDKPTRPAKKETPKNPKDA